MAETKKKSATKSDKTVSTATRAAKAVLTDNMSRVTKRKVTKSALLARREAAKTLIYDNRALRRATKNSDDTKATKQTKQIGRAPASARITPAKGPVQKLASRTQSFNNVTSPRRWLLVDAADHTVGRLASELANLLRGKHKPTFTPNQDMGDFVVVINADKVKFTSFKATQKKYYDYSGYVGGLKEITADKLLKKNPEEVLLRAVRGMISRGPLGYQQIKQLKIYRGSQHPHSAQKPVVWKLRYNEKQ